MNKLMNGWFSELNNLWPGVCLSLKVEEVLHEENSQYQNIAVLQTKTHGKALILDGIIQCTEYDEFAYQEMISFLPLLSHPNPRKVLIIGGGDGGVAREVCKLPQVEDVHQVEIDDAVLRISKKYIPSISIGLSHPKLTVYVEDGFKFMESHVDEYDVIITDSSDPVGPAVVLFQKKYFELMKKSLKPDGIICSQTGTYWENMDIVKQTLNICRDVFPVASLACVSVPTYPTGQIGFVLGTLNQEKIFNEPSRILNEREMEEMKLKYYSPDIHRASFVLPRFVEKSLNN